MAGISADKKVVEVKEWMKGLPSGMLVEVMGSVIQKDKKLRSWLFKMARHWDSLGSMGAGGNGDSDQ